MFLSWAIKNHRSLYIAITYNKALRISFHFIMVCPRKLRVFQIFSTIHSIGIENSRSAKKALTSGWIAAAAALDFFFSFFLLLLTCQNMIIVPRRLFTYSLSIRRVDIHNLLFFLLYSARWMAQKFLMMVVIHSKKRFLYHQWLLWKSLKVIFFGINHFRVFTAQDIPSNDEEEEEGRKNPML